MRFLVSCLLILCCLCWFVPSAHAQYGAVTTIQTDAFGNQFRVTSFPSGAVTFDPFVTVLTNPIYSSRFVSVQGGLTYAPAPVFLPSYSVPVQIVRPATVVVRRGRVVVLP